jgi:hypothetical protein
MRARLVFGVVAALAAASCVDRALLHQGEEPRDGGPEAALADDAGARRADGQVAGDDGGLAGHDAAVVGDDAGTIPQDAAGGPEEPPPCGRTGTPPTDPVARLKYAFAAHWRGQATTPFGWTCGPYSVDLRFEPDGHYSGHVLPPAPDYCVVFYYGSDEDSPVKVYELTDLAPVTGDGRGWIDIYWSGGGTTRGTLDRIRFNADLTVVELEFWRTWAGSYGPVSYVLECVAP